MVTHMVHYDVIVIGAGGVGSAALYHLARRGARVVGLDRFPPGHDRGSSHGQTRVIRLAYYEHPDYVPLLLRAYDLWHELEQVAGKKLFHQVGILGGGLPEGELISGILRSSAKHGLLVEQLSAQEAALRWPGYRMPDNFRGLFEARAGYLMVEDCVRAHAEAAIRAGAELHCGSAVRGWKIDSQGVTVETDHETLSADRLVITAGAWAGGMLLSLKVPFQVLRKPLFWYRTLNSTYQLDSGCPCFMFETLGGIFYGVPQDSELGVKVAEHTGGLAVDDPLHPDRTLHAADQRRIETCLAAHLPGVSSECTAHSVCMYTMTPDGHFVVDRHPQHAQVVLTAGLSGHGFKFTSVLGEIMAELALEAHTQHAIDFLSCRRFTV